MNICTRCTRRVDAVWLIKPKFSYSFAQATGTEPPPCPGPINTVCKNCLTPAEITEFLKPIALFVVERMWMNRTRASDQIDSVRQQFEKPRELTASLAHVRAKLQLDVGLETNVTEISERALLARIWSAK